MSNTVFAVSSSLLNSRLKDRTSERRLDMTPKQRQQRMELVKQMKDRQQTTGEKNLIIVNGKIVVRKPRDTQVTSN